MTLSELKKQVDKLSRAAKKAKIDPEVKLVVSPSFPILTSLKSQVLSSLDGSLDIKEIGGKHTVFLAEDKEEENLFGAIVEGFEIGHKSRFRKQ